MIRDLSSHPTRDENDTPGAYLTRLSEAVPRGLIATILSQSPDEFYSVALRKYMRSFSFFGDPLDMAIRKLLMEVELPRETQQIDRVIQGFANRYHECNPGIFSSTGMLLCHACHLMSFAHSFIRPSLLYCILDIDSPHGCFQ